MSLNLAILPAEILALIAELADAQDLTTLRLVCWALNNVAVKPLGQAFFTERVHTISEKALAETVLMSAHPDFGPHMRQLGFNSVLLPPPTVSCDLSERAIFKAAACVKRAYDEQIEFLANGAFECQLVQVLENLKKWGSQPIKIHVCCNRDPLYGWGWLTLLPDDPGDKSTLTAPRSSSRGSMHHIIADFARAIELMEYPTSGIILDFGERTPGPTDVLNYLNLGGPNGGTMTKSLTHDVLGGDLLARRFVPGSGKSYDSLHYIPVTGVLEIDSGRTRGIHSDFISLTRWLPENTLTKLSLKDFSTRWGAGMGECLRRNRHLKHLEMDTCLFTDLIWSALFARLGMEDDAHALARLEYFRCSNMIYEQLELYVHSEKLIQACAEVHELQGRDEVLAGLEMLIARLEPLEELIYSYDDATD